MKKLLIFLLLLSPVGRAEELDPLFGGRQNQLSLQVGQSIGHGGAPFSIFKFDKKPNSLFLIGLQYSQPDMSFRLPGRKNVELMLLWGHEEMEKFSQNMVGMSWDILLLQGESFYLGVSLGAYIKSEIDERVGSRFTFGEKLFVGYRFSQLNLEFFARHLSNGDLDPINHGFDFIGFALARNY
jgi:hypothetical protein